MGGKRRSRRSFRGGSLDPIQNCINNSHSMVQARSCIPSHGSHGPGPVPGGMFGGWTGMDRQPRMSGEQFRTCLHNAQSTQQNQECVRVAGQY